MGRKKNVDVAVVVEREKVNTPVLTSEPVATQTMTPVVAQVTAQASTEAPTVSMLSTVGTVKKSATPKAVQVGKVTPVLEPIFVIE